MVHKSVPKSLSISKLAYEGKLSRVCERSGQEQLQMAEFDLTQLVLQYSVFRVFVLDLVQSKLSASELTAEITCQITFDSRDELTAERACLAQSL